MIQALSLAFLLALQGSPAHADLHPAEADVYVELGDLSTVLPALDGAPLLRLLRDERVTKLLEQVGKVPQGSMKELVERGLASAAPASKPEGWLPGMKSSSLSIITLGPESADAPSVAWLALADFAAPEQAQALHAALVASADSHEPMSAPVSGVERLTMGAKPEDEMWAVVSATRLVVGSTATKIEDYLARADKKTAGLGRNERFQKNVTALEKASGTPLLWFALNRPLQELVAKVEGAEGAAAFDKIPGELNPFTRPVVARMQLVGDRFVTEMLTGGAPEDAAAKPVNAAWLEPAPPSSMLVYATAFDGAATGKRMRALLAQDEQSAATLAALETKLGFGPERVLGRLGPGLTVFAAPPAGPALPELHAWIDCADAAAFTADLEALVKALGETLPGFELKTKPYKFKKAGSEEKLEVPITTLSLPPGMVEIPMMTLAPSYAPVGNRLVFGLGSMDVKSELKRALGGDGDPIVEGKTPLSAAGFTLPGEARSVLLMDWAKLLGGVLDMVKAFAPMMEGQVPFDAKKLQELPPGSIFAEFFKPTFHYSRPLAGGLYRRNEASFGPETWLGLMALGNAASRMFAGAGTGGQIPDDQPAIPIGGDGK